MVPGANHTGRQANSRASIDEDRLLARLALKRGMVTEDQLEAVYAFRAAQGAAGRTMALEEALLSLKAISRRQLELLRRARDLASLRKSDRLFARIAVKNGIVAQKDIDDALRQQSKLYRENRRFIALGDLLRQSGLIAGRPYQAIHNAIARCARSPSKTCSIIGFEETTQEMPGAVPEAEAPAAGTASLSEGGRITPFLGESAIELQVAFDRLSASIRLKAALPPDFGPQDLRSFLSSKGIVFGVADDETLMEIIRSEGASGRPIVVARGIPPEAAKSAEIQFLIDSKLQEEPVEENVVDVVDLKERGVIPQVRAGDVLAVKTPPVQGIDGVDVYGMEIPVREAKDLPILVGSGVQLSPDKLQAVAKIDGRPQISAYGRLSVHPELVIMGDVSFETGNIDFAGSILVGGVVQDGFKVRGASLIAREIGKADIDVEGDVMVFGGILGAKVRTQASVKGTHIHASHIQAMGDVIVERGIVDSRISTSGKCIARRGTILASSIVARRGIEAQHIGSERSKPCALGIGFDPIAESQAETCKAMLAMERQESERLTAEMATLKKELAEVEKEIGMLAQEQDAALRQQREQLSRIAGAEEAGFAEEGASLRNELAQLEAGIQRVAQRLDALLEREDRLKELLAHQREGIRKVEHRVAQLSSELSVITDWATKDAKRPVVKVHGNIYAGTTIKGPFASVSLRENYRSVAFGERDTDPANGTPTGAARIVMQKLKR